MCALISPHTHGDNTSATRDTYALLLLLGADARATGEAGEATLRQPDRPAHMSPRQGPQNPQKHPSRPHHTPPTTLT